MLSDSPTHLGPCLGVCHEPEEFVVQEVVGEEELQKQIITGARVDVNKAPTHYQQSTIKAPARQKGKAYLGDKIGKSDYVDKHVASAVESMADLRQGLVFTFR